MQRRAEKDVPADGNPVTTVRHTLNGTTHECLGLRVHLWCPGCQSLHAPTFRCPEHGGPASGPVWDGDPHSHPFTMEPSLLVHADGGYEGHPRCHSFIRAGRWQFLGDSGHDLAGQTVDLEPLPDWLAQR